MRIHKSVTVDRVIAAIEDNPLSSPGFCTACGIDVYGVEPDARKYPCDSCDADAVYGAEELLFYL